MALNLKPVLTNERYVQYMARNSALYDPNLAVDENVGAEYLTMMSNLAGKDIDVSKYKPGVARYSAGIAIVLVYADAPLRCCFPFL